MKTTTNAHEHVARIRKVGAIIGILEELDVTAEEASLYAPDEQAEIARMAGVNAPSPRSWQAVIDRLAEMGTAGCVFCGTDGCDARHHGEPCHRLCAEEADYRRAQEIQDEVRESI